MKKIVLSIILSFIFILFTAFAYAFTPETNAVIANVNIFVKGNRITLEREPVAINGRILAPARTVFENIGARVDWYPEKGSFNIIKGNTVISMAIGQTNAKVNNVSTQLEIPPILVRGTVMVPVRFVAETLNTPVSWDGDNRAVHVGERTSNVNISRGGRQYVVVIDPGHGGNEPGAVYGGIKEKNLNLDIARKLQALLKAEGITVYMTRSDDSYVGLSQRSALANRVNVDMLISIHNNAYKNSSVTGTMTLYYPYSGVNKDGLSSKTLASIVQNEMSKLLGSRNIGIVPRSDLTVLRASRVPAVIVEVGYMSNYNELSKLKSDSYRQKAAEAIKKAILKALNR
ncbi:MAG: N-acetylmuramoyl-L-alanine amidase [Firmicutes bacterium]|nr:N-acetylmuramoyl-L-alanine amidase [Bacillota bacterium]